MIKKFLYLILILSFSACTIQKRLYRKGFYIEKTFSKKENGIDHKNQCLSNHPLKNTTNDLEYNYDFYLCDANVEQPLFNNEQPIKLHHYLHFTKDIIQKNKFLQDKTFNTFKKQINRKINPDSNDDKQTIRKQYLSLIFYSIVLLMALMLYYLFYSHPYGWLNGCVISFGGFLSVLLLILFIPTFSVLLIVYFKERNKVFNLKYKGEDRKIKRKIIGLKILKVFLVLIGIIANMFVLYLIPGSWLMLILIVMGIALIILISQKINRLIMTKSNQHSNDAQTDLKKLQIVMLIKLLVIIISFFLVFAPLIFNILTANAFYWF